MSDDQDRADKDPGQLMQEIQERISQLTQDRDAQLREIVSQKLAALDDVQKRVEEAKKQHEGKMWTNLYGDSVEERAKLVQELVESVQRRKEIEEAMVGLAVEADEVIRRVEELMDVGLRGREKDAIKHLGENRGQKKRE